MVAILVLVSVRMGQGLLLGVLLPDYNLICKWHIMGR